jgi:Ni,Fe-hydrogenase III large subunit/Ni,Fe-hydrogenase III component G
VIYGMGLPVRLREPTEIRAVSPEIIGATVADLLATGYRYLTLVGTDERAYGRGFGLWVTLFLPGGRDLHLRATLDPTDPRYPAITRLVPAAHWDEREMADLLGFVPVGHPDPRRLVLREDWPAGVHPLRKDFTNDQAPPPSRHDAYHFLPAHGEKLLQIPVGPIHAGIIEPGHFRFVTVGELVLELEARLFYTHRGIEKLVEGRDPAAALPVVERICGACAFSHALAFCEAVEAIAGVTVPPRARWARTLCLELERLYNHVGDSGNICAGTGFAVGTMTGLRIKEKIQQAIETLVGHRFLRDVSAIGGLRRDLDAAPLNALRELQNDLRVETRRFGSLILGTESFVERMQKTGVLETATVRDLGGVGVAARASGVDVDLRRDRPHAGYEDFNKVITQSTGDVEARLRQRLAEIEVSWEILGTLLDDEPTGPIRVEVGPLPAHRVGVGAVESPRGADVHWLLTDAHGKIDRLRVRSASLANWPLVPTTAPGNLVPDFPLINKSFELCYACLDR